MSADAYNLLKIHVLVVEISMASMIILCTDNTINNIVVFLSKTGELENELQGSFYRCKEKDNVSIT